LPGDIYFYFLLVNKDYSKGAFGFHDNYLLKSRTFSSVFFSTIQQVVGK